PMSAFFLNKKFLLFLALLPFFYMTYSFASLDFWNDEMYSLRYFTFVPLATTVTDYHVPNNHIFFNLLNQIFLRTAGISDLHRLMDDPFLIRLLPFIYSLGTLFYLWLTGKKFFNEFTAFLSVAILATTFPFFSYFLQMRGYGLSMFFLMVMIYHTWNLESNFSRKDFLLVVLAVCLSIYTIPLNLYFVFSIGVFYFIRVTIYCFNFFRRKHEHRRIIFFPGKNFKIIIALAIGSACSFLLYLPIYKQVFFNNYVKSHGWFKEGFSLPGIVFNAFLSGRYLLPALFLAGIFFYFIKKDKHGSFFFRGFIFLICVLLVPFIISFVRGDQAPDRTFVILAPVFSLCFAAGIDFFLRSVFKAGNKKNVLLLILVAYCNLTFIFYYSKVRNHVRNDIEISNRSQDIKYNYYLAYFHPKKLVESFRKIYTAHPAALIIRESDYHGMREYLDKYEI